MTPLPDILTRRVRTDPSAPFLTHYGSPVERTELSARTFANWVDKTANLLIDDADLVKGDRVRLDLLATAPGHWMTLVWVMAAWRGGICVTDGEADLVVTGPSADGGDGSYACSLHPLGLGLRDLPGGVTDYSTTALAQPDAWLDAAPAPDTAAWDVDTRTLTAADLTQSPARAGRSVVIGSGDAYAVVTDALIAPLLGGGSTVVVAPGLADAEMARLREAEL